MKTVSQVRRKPKQRTRLQAMREEANLGVRELAGFTGVSAPTISRVESGRTPDVRNALLLAQFFETSIEDLFGYLKERKP